MRNKIIILFGILVLFLSATTERDNCEVARTLWTHGEGSYEQGSPESQQNFDSVLQLCPGYAMAWRERGVPFLKRGDFGRWAKDIDMAVKLDPLGYLPIRGWCRFDFLRDYEGAIHDLQRLDTLVNFHTIYASDYNIYLIIGQAYAALGQYDKALIYFNKDIDRTIQESGESWVGLYDYLQRGVLKYKMGDLNGALDDFDKQIMKYESLADPYYFKGLILAKQGKKSQSKVQLAKALELINGKGFKHRDSYVEVQNEIYPSDIEEAFAKLD